MGIFDDLKAAEPPKVFGDLKQPNEEKPKPPRPLFSGGYTGTPDLPLEDKGLGPIEWATLANPAARAMRGAQALTSGLPWFVGAAARGAAAAGTYGATESLSRFGQRDNRPLAQTGMAALSGAVLGPPAEYVTGSLTGAMRPLARPSRGPRAPVEPTAAPQASSVPRQPLTGQSAQQYPGMDMAAVEKLRTDPEFVRRIGQLGGGRVISNPETIAEAIRVGPMSPAEVAGWKAGTRANEVDVARASMAFDDSWQRFLGAIESGSATDAKAASAAVNEMMPGFENIRATGGRMTQIQSLFVQNKLAKIAGELADMQQKGVPLDQVRKVWLEHKADLAREAALSKMSGSIMGALDRLETFATRMKLTSPITTVWNTTSNALNFMVNRPAEIAVRAGAKAMQGNVAGAASDLRYAFGTTQGLVNGLRRFAAEFADEAPQQIGGKAAEYASRTWRGPARFFDPFRHLSAQDALWKGILEDSKLSALAYESASREGLKGDALAKKVAQLVSNPPETWRAKAVAEGLEHTFQSDPGPVVNSIADAISKVPGGRLIVPFIRTPFNIARYQAQRSPLGMLSSRNISDAMAGGDRQAEAIGRVASGTAMALGAYALVTRGEVTGAYPRDPGERARWEAEGRQPYSIRSGDKWVAYNRVQPAGQYVSQAASLKEAIDAGDKEGVGALYTKLVLDGGRAVMDLPFLSGLSSLVEAIQDPTKQGSRFLQNTATGVIPNLSRDVRIQTDPTKRVARGVVPGIYNMLPGRSQQLEPQTDVFGQEVGYEPNRVLRALKIVSPVRDTTLRRSDYFPSEPRAELKIKGQKQPAKLEGPQSTAFLKEMGAATQEAYRAVVSQPGFRQLDPDEQERRITNAVNRARQTVRARWKAGR